ncbi:protein kinase domain-containing protein [Nonomuraea jabiensis]|uniref:non-specific serine/threonine protein kinase n=1 Tax=Nonomuraea jabiensis TaxID=882448 RepID=A0A7W9G823_9ACTN|nr:protein kinase [Nonomuraea jabiensis]MBB5778867.1 serine/threonine protein kinase [Nonomuraea jabiensis]
MTVTTERVRGYRLLERAGQDGPWTAHLAQSAATGAEVLVKTLACHRADRRALKRIVRGFGFPEALAAHDGVIPVLEVGATGDGRPYLVTPVHGGLTLAERPGRSQPMTLDEVLGVLRAVADALAATHAAGGVHGRVTPENVVVAGRGVALTGFAMSALMSIVELPDGTLPSVHAAPEELEGHPPVPASDVYSLGSMAYELLAGRPAFPLDGAGGTAKFVLGVLTEAPPPLPPGVPPDLAETLLKAMAKAPDARPTATDLSTVASRLLTPHPPTTRLPTGDPAQPPTARLPAGDAGQPATARLPLGDPARLPLGDAGQPLTARLPSPSPSLEDSGAVERSGPRELVWTVDPDRSQVRPPAGPQPFSQPPAEVSAPHAPVAEQGRRSRVPLLVTTASALAVLVGAGSVALAMNGRPGASQPAGATAAALDPTTSGTPPQADHQPPDQPTDQPADQPTDRPTPPSEPRPQTSMPSEPPARRQTVDPAAVAAYRPKSLKVVSDNGTTVTLAWKAVRKSGYPVVIQQAPGNRLVSAASGSNTYTLGGLDPATGYCFKVGAVVTLGQPSSVAWSSALCIRGAAETSPGGQDDQVQPPIVLPLATPPPS